MDSCSFSYSDLVSEVAAAGDSDDVDEDAEILEKCVSCSCLVQKTKANCLVGPLSKMVHIDIHSFCSSKIVLIVFIINYH